MFNPYYTQFQQPQAFFNQQPMQQPQQAPQQPSTAVLYAPTHKDFANVGVQPGRQALIIAQNEPYMAFKSADAMGMVQTTMYRIEQVSGDDLDAPAVEYATKNELAQLQAIVQQIVDGMSKPGKKEVATE